MKEENRTHYRAIARERDLSDRVTRSVAGEDSIVTHILRRSKDEEERNEEEEAIHGKREMSGSKRRCASVHVCRSVHDALQAEIPWAGTESARWDKSWTPTECGGYRVILRQSRSRVIARPLGTLDPKPDPRFGEFSRPRLTKNSLSVLSSLWRSR